MRIRGFVLLTLCFVLSSSTVFAIENLTCSVRAGACNSDEIKVFGITGTSNAHAFEPSVVTGQNVCCLGPQNLAADTDGVLVLNVDGFGHSEKISEGNYNYTINITADAAIDCTYQHNVGTNLCTDRYTCLASMDGDTNAHVGDCSTYDEKICCRCTAESESIFQCDDGIDNDCDGNIDCEDWDCRGRVEGLVHGYEEGVGQVNISGALVQGYYFLNVSNVTYTNASGHYSLVTQCGANNLVASADQFARQTQQMTLWAGGVAYVNFTKNASLVFESPCEEDCTLTSGNTLMASCDGINGCAFYDSTHASVCDGVPFNSDDPNFQPWVKEYDSLIPQDILCAIPAQAPFNRATIAATFQCPEGTNAQAVSQSVARVGGKGVKVNMVVCAE